MHYNDLNSYFKNKFGNKVVKICIDAGFTCPNRDGTISKNGCIYCNNDSFSHPLINGKVTIKEQGERFIKHYSDKGKDYLYLAYFQPYSNTYSDINTLSSLYNEALSIDHVIGLSISTRPDCVNDEILQMINQIGETKEVWIEYGVETSHNETLKMINRGHTWEDFLNAYNLTRKYPNIKICVHIIYGLPSENLQMMYETADKIAEIDPDGIKIHQLAVVKDTQLYELYKNNPDYIQLITVDDFLNILGYTIQKISSKVVIHKLFGMTKREYLMSPRWDLKGKTLYNTVMHYFSENNIVQGSLYRY